MKNGYGLTPAPSDIYHQQRRERRERIASALLAGIAAGGLPSDASMRASVLDKVVVYADELIERLAK